MMTADYARMMARYNAWQNTQMIAAMRDLSASALDEDRGAFFGSILGTANHILWADSLWMARLEGGEVPQIAPADSPSMCATFAVWSAERFRMDGRIALWAKSLRNVDLSGTLSWHSVVLGKDMSQPMGAIVTHLFNHQTHHRGQIHAMLTAAGATAPVTDLILMPQED